MTGDTTMKDAVTQIEESGTNVDAELGRPDAEEMLVKAQLASRIAEIIKRRRLT